MFSYTSHITTYSVSFNVRSTRNGSGVFSIQPHESKSSGLGSHTKAAWHDNANTRKRDTSKTLIFLLRAETKKKFLQIDKTLVKTERQKTRCQPTGHGVKPEGDRERKMAREPGAEKSRVFSILA